ncbi:hypothetical protein FA13DRAFT_1238851 [Coprinellus micaceus]|uniref:Uncharacterized protein n=1 Tax=Coprinellus micaceus TaxID=71717 RepID=A0A4Y7TRP9_COPMI|nr:hypothetical protein FA13DRAFT_1238851 [Coprinellus micaceus]
MFMRPLPFLLLFSFLASVLADKLGGLGAANNLRRGANGKAQTKQDPELEYTPTERKRNELLKKLGLPIEPPKAKKGSDVEAENMRPFYSSRGPDHFASRGYIGVHKESISGPLLGYLDCHRVVDTKDNATLYAFIVNGPVMEIGVVGTHLRLAVTAGPFGVDLEPYSKNFHLPRHTLFNSIPGAGPNHDKAQAFLFETSVFMLNPDGDEIEVQWVNRNGQHTQTEVAVVNDRVYFTGDLQAFRTYSSQKVDHVELKWYPSD